MGFNKKYQKSSIRNWIIRTIQFRHKKLLVLVPEIVCTLLNSRHEIDRSAHNKWHPINLKLFSSLHADDQLGGEGKKRTIEGRLRTNIFCHPSHFYLDQKMSH